jgi:hypothetical protein
LVTVNIAVAAPTSIISAFTVCWPGKVWVGTVIIAVKLPSSSVVTVWGTVGIAVPSQLIVTVLNTPKPVPVTVTAAKPEAGLRVIASF